MIRSRRLVCVFLCLALACPCLAADPAAPPPPKRYDVRLRYQIDAFRKERLVLFDELLKHFKEIGFDKNPGPDDEPENPKYTHMTGSIASEDARKLLVDRHVKSLLLTPAGGMVPEGDTPVRVQLDLVGGLNTQNQQKLADQVREVLAPLGFREAVGYESRGNRRLLGMIPAGKLDGLLEDLRKQPAAEKLGAPFASRSPLLVTEVMLGLPPAKERPVAAEPPKGQEKLTPELRMLLPKDKEAGKVDRMEVILTHTPADDDREWVGTLARVAPNLAIEGRVGPLVTVSGPVNAALALAALPSVSTVRLPRSAQPRLLSDGKDDPKDVLSASGLENLHKLGHKGAKIKLAIIDGDFRGWQALVADKKLPVGTRLVDLTAQRNNDLLPDPMPANDKSLGHGARAALAAATAAPNVELTLIRVDPASPYQLYEVARTINGDAVHSENLDARYQHLADVHKDLEERQEMLLLEKKLAFKSVAGEEEDRARKRRDDYRKKEAAYLQDEKDYQAALQRYLQLRRDLASLKGIPIVASSLVWNEGQPVDGSGALSRYFDDRPFKAALWFQSAGDTRGQAWSGLFRDADANGVMEFIAPDKPLPKERWTPELNFLSWQPVKGDQSPDLPAKTRFRVSMQWREPHDPDVAKDDADLYRTPLANLRLVLLRQLDASGKTRPADDLEVVAQSVGLPQRLDNQRNSATYEQTVEFEVKDAGRYALRVEGKLPASIRPANAPTLPALETQWELHPRIFIATLEGPGRVLFQDFAADQASLGTPGDARSVITVGAADRTGMARPATGHGIFNQEPSLKPDVLAFDLLGSASGEELYGAGEAAGFAAGFAATTLSAGASRLRFLESVQATPGGLLQLPKDWPAAGR
jgi:hypothetical protein